MSAHAETPRRRGRPTKKTREAMDTIVRAIQNYAHTAEEAADMAGVRRSTLYEWLKADEVFSGRVAEARAKLSGLVKQTALRRGLGGWIRDPVTGKPVLDSKTGLPMWDNGDNRLLQFLAMAVGGLRPAGEVDQGELVFVVESNIPRPVAQLGPGEVTVEESDVDPRPHQAAG